MFWSYRNNIPSNWSKFKIYKNNNIPVNSRNLEPNYDLSINYDQNKVSVGSVAKGELFQGGNQPFFHFEDDGSGVLTIYVGYLGPDGNSVSGTGNIANIIFNTLSAGQSQISISSTSRILDPDAKAITLNGYGKGTIDAQ